MGACLKITAPRSAWRGRPPDRRAASGQENDDGRVRVPYRPGGLEAGAGAITGPVGHWTHRGRWLRLLDAAGAPVAGMGMSPGVEGFFTLAGSSKRLEHLAAGGYTLVVEGGPTKPATITEGGVAVVELP